MLKLRFPPVLGVCSTQTLVKIYNTYPKQTESRKLDTPSPACSTIPLHFLKIFIAISDEASGGDNRSDPRFRLQLDGSLFISGVSISDPRSYTCADAETNDSIETILLVRRKKERNVVYFNQCLGSE